VYEEELSRVWPSPDKERAAKIKSFARQQGLQVAFYKEVFARFLSGRVVRINLEPPAVYSDVSEENLMFLSS